MIDIIFISYILTGLILMWYDRDSKNLKNKVKDKVTVKDKVIYVDFEGGRQENSKEAGMKKTM